MHQSQLISEHSAGWFGSKSGTFIALKGDYDNLVAWVNLEVPGPWMLDPCVFTVRVLAFNYTTDFFMQ